MSKQTTREERALKVMESVNWDSSESEMFQSIRSNTSRIFGKDTPSVFFVNQFSPFVQFVLFSFPKQGEDNHSVMLFADSDGGSERHHFFGKTIDNVGHLICLLFGDMDLASRLHEQTLDTFDDLDQMFVWMDCVADIIDPVKKAGITKLL